MTDKILCFSLNGYLLGVEPDQVEKILINKHPHRHSFTLETGVEVRQLQEYIPLPGDEGKKAENILFIKDQKDFHGFTVDRVQGYMKLRGSSSVHLRAGGAAHPSTTGAAPAEGGERDPIRYFVRSDQQYIPVMDLQYITNNPGAVDDDTIEEIRSFAPEPEAEGETQQEQDSPEVSEEEVYRSIDEEINRAKAASPVDETIRSEKRGAVMPLMVNLAVVTLFGAGILSFIGLMGERSAEQELGKTVSGVEEEVIREIQRRSQQEVEEQKKKLEEARNRLQSLEQERNTFLDRQDDLLSQREKELEEEFQRRLEEVRQRIAAEGGDFDEEYSKERERLLEEYAESRQEVREEIEQVKQEYEQALQERQEQINEEMSRYTDRISQIEQQLQEEQVKLEQAEERFRSELERQEEYRAFRKQLNGMYARALDHISRENYDQGIQELNEIPPLLERAGSAGIAGAEELDVEDRLVENLTDLASDQQGRIDLAKIAARTFQAGDELEKLGNLDEALSRFHTAANIAPDQGLQQRALNRAGNVLEKLYGMQADAYLGEMNEAASQLYERSLAMKESEQYDQAIKNLEELLTDYPGTEVAGPAVDELNQVAALKREKEQQLLKAQINEAASDVMEEARANQRGGLYQEALKGYETIVRNYIESDYTNEAVSQIVKINRDLRSANSGSLIVTSDVSKVGVIIKLSPDDSFLFNLGTRDGVKEGQVLGIYRKEDGEMGFIGNVKITDVYPTISKGMIMFSDQDLRVGDIISSAG